MKRTALLASMTGAMLAILLAATPLAAFDLRPAAITIEGGFSEGRVDADRYGANLRWNIKPEWFQVGDWHLVSFVEFGINFWNSSLGRTQQDELFDFGLTPVLRYEMDPKRGFAPFIEAGAGLHLHSRNEINDKDFDIPFAFGSHLGVGARFGGNGQYELMYRYQHQSNAGIGDSNPGINFHLMSLGIHY